MIVSVDSNGMYYDCVKFHCCVSIKDDKGNLVGRTPPFNLGTGTEVAHAFSPGSQFFSIILSMNL